MILLRLPVMLLRLLVQSTLLALGQVWANKVRAMLTMTGIIIGVASVTAVIAALTGLKANVLRDFEAFGTNKIFIFPRRPQTGPQRQASWQSLTFKPEMFDELLEHCPSVAEISRMFDTADTVRAGDQSVPDVTIIGIDPSWHRIENRWVQQGRPFSHIDATEGTQVCLIDTKLQEKLQLDRDCVGQTLQIGSRTFVIVGLLEPRASTGMFGGEGRNFEAFVPFTTLYRDRRSMDYVIAASRTPELSEDARAEINFYLRKMRRLKIGDPDDFGTEAIEQYLRQFKEVATVITMVASAIVGISLLVGGVGIMNIMLVSVSERTREIGLRKAVGARPAAILFQFLVEAVILCLIGGLIGLGTGQLITNGLAAVPQLKLQQAHIPLWAVMLSFGFAAGVGLIFGMFPAIKAARLDPIVALRHE